MSIPVTGIILAGGASRRMGRDKAQLSIDGKSLLEHQVEKLQALGLQEILLSGAAAPPAGTRAVPDRYPGRGPLGGLHACLRAAACPHCLVVPVDMPLLPEQVLRALLERHLRGDASITILSAPRRLQPLVGVYDAGLWGTIEALIREGPGPVRALLDAVPPAVLPYDGPEEGLLNCNTPEEYRLLCQVLQAAAANGAE